MKIIETINLKIFMCIPLNLKSIHHKLNFEKLPVLETLAKSSAAVSNVVFRQIIAFYGAFSVTIHSTAKHNVKFFKTSEIWYMCSKMKRRIPHVNLKYVNTSKQNNSELFHYNFWSVKWKTLKGRDWQAGKTQDPYFGEFQIYIKYVAIFFSRVIPMIYH